MAVTVSLGRLYTRIICSIFPLFMESNALAKWTNKTVTSVFFLKKILLWFNRLSNLWYCESISPKITLILSKNFLNFWFDVIEKQSIINFSRYGSKSYTSVVLGDSEVTFLEGRGRCSLLSIFQLCYGYIQRCRIREVSHQISLSSILLGVFCWSRQLFLFLIFVSTMLSSSWINFPSLKSSWLLIIFMISLCCVLVSECLLY